MIENVNCHAASGPVACVKRGRLAEVDGRLITCGLRGDDSEGAVRRWARLPCRCLSGYYGQMDKATVSRLKDNLSAYLRKVRAGQPVVIYDRDVPIARLERIESSGRGSDRLAALQAQGIVKPPVKALSVRQLLAGLEPIARGGAQLRRALEDERGEGR
jgi:antitoxin (DNA-binding transcriptional repressor) of toxin-antitoxin stability system